MASLPNWTLCSPTIRSSFSVRPSRAAGFSHTPSPPDENRVRLLGVRQAHRGRLCAALLLFVALATPAWAQESPAAAIQDVITRGNAAQVEAIAQRDPSII